MIYIESSNMNPYYNLALEEFVFEHFNEDVFMLWQNSNTIVVGKYQNTIEEISLKFAKDNQIKVVRRLSGGGAVYHDMGNLNFTFIAKKNDENAFCFEHFTGHILDVLKTFNVKGEFNSRNDLVVEGKKFSGNSQYIKNGKVLHHGTLLFNSELEVLVNALKVGNAKIESKAIKSIHERVTNLKAYMPNITLEEFKNAIIKHMFGANDVQIYEFSEEDLAEIEQLCDTKYSTWKWNYGESPKCNVIKKGKCECGLFQVCLEIEEGAIKSVKIFGDFFAGENFSELVALLVGCRFTENGIRNKVEQIANVISGIDAEWLVKLILY